MFGVGSQSYFRPVADAANFLVQLHDKGYQSQSLNACRSAVSSVHDTVDGLEVGKYPMISRSLKGAYHVRSPLPRCIFTWDVQVALHHLEDLGSSASLSDGVGSYKGTRTSCSADLASLQLDRQQERPEGLGKTNFTRENPQRVFLPFFPSQQ